MKQYCAMLSLLLLLTGCAAHPSENGYYDVYYRTNLESGGGADAICAQKERGEGETETRVASDLLRRMIAADNELYTSPLPEGTVIQSIQIENGLALVDLSEEYGTLSGIDLTLADACITMTLCQFPSIERVSIMANGKLLPYRDEQIVSDADVLLSYMDDKALTLRARLYFEDTETGELSSEIRMIQMYEGQTKVEVVLETLLLGPESRDMQAILPKETEIRSIQVEDGICYVNLSENFIESIPEDLQRQKNVVYSLVKSLCSVSDIQAVQITVEGENIGFYGDVDISVPLN